ncbi:MAG: methyltransferase domain-containing protein [Desulfuromonadaceae bacterium]|nr:methyltransferase domain-containing protein [Desulfuromonadaceae bacterium]
MSTYLMEHEKEAERLCLKTDRAVVERQARWAGIGAGMRVLDVGCGAGVTSAILYDLVQPEGTVLGIDASQERIDYAQRYFGQEGVAFECRDFRQELEGIGEFDFIWVRFVLEYHRTGSSDIVRHLSRLLKPGGVLCLIDLDHNCLNHYGLSARLERNIQGIMDCLSATADFDPYMGRRLFSFLFDLGLADIDVKMTPHHLIFGELGEVDRYNWWRKLEVAARRSGWRFADYKRGFEEFASEFMDFFSDPRRFTYTPMVACRGIRR